MAELRHTICFDFPERNGDPLFSGWHKGALGFAPSLATAAKWATEEEAQRHLDNSYGPEVRAYGSVVEIGLTEGTR